MNREEAIKLLKSHYPTNEQIINESLEFLIPELKVSEDERIRKVLADYFKRYKGQEERGGSTMFCGIPTDDILTWLEKQGEQKPTDKIHLGKEYKCIASPRYSTFMRDKIYKPEDKFLCSLMNFCSDCFEPIEDSEQNDFTSNANKVEPKFKLGDWITDGNITIQIEGIKNNCYLYCGYCALYSIKTADKVYHLWTIEDAKEGDILVSANNHPFIHNGCRDKSCLGAYCGITVDNEFKISDNSNSWIKYNWTFNEDIRPATKGQCDFLFQKMKENGYEWDAENKKILTL